ncbi:hypothetical protein SAMN04488513_107176 [Pseudozobellia thermophila]|uniref:Uncharacterized protein n=1 Tax=Pseudozobellia thermophila TaxID=192903 RepID=A0A1M6LIQ8_9FLAO|nr:hypothetical protein SAMN04488513_107176 [Pseudozobellia thermophila]
MGYWKYILMIVGCTVYLIFFSKSVKHSKSAVDENENSDPYVSKETSDLYHDIRAFFGRLGAIFMILWSAYELYKYFS